MAAGAVREGDAAAGEILRETRGLPTKIRSACGVLMLPSGYLTYSHGKWPIEIDGLPIKNGDVPWRTVK